MMGQWKQSLQGSNGGAGKRKKTWTGTGWITWSGGERRTFCADGDFDSLPLATVDGEGADEAGMFLGRPVLTALGEDVLLALLRGGVCGGGGGGGRHGWVGGATVGRVRGAKRHVVWLESDG